MILGPVGFESFGKVGPVNCSNIKLDGIYIKHIFNINIYHIGKQLCKI